MVRKAHIFPRGPGGEDLGFRPRPDGGGGHGAERAVRAYRVLRDIVAAVVRHIGIPAGRVDGHGKGKRPGRYRGGDRSERTVYAYRVLRNGAARAVRDIHMPSRR